MLHFAFGAPSSTTAVQVIGVGGAEERESGGGYGEGGRVGSKQSKHSKHATSEPEQEHSPSRGDRAGGKSSQLLPPSQRLNGRKLTKDKERLSAANGEPPAPAVEEDDATCPPGVCHDWIICGHFHTIVLRLDGRATCFGDSRNQRLAVPPLPPGKQYIGGDASAQHSVLLRSDGQAVAFGKSRRDSRCVVPPLPEGMSYVSVATGAAHTIFVRSDGQALSVGSNLDGQCDVPALPPAVHYVQAVAGDYHTVLIRSDGQAVAFGQNFHAQCRVPRLPPGVEFVGGAAGECHTVLLRSDGRVTAFGLDADGQCTIPELPMGAGQANRQAKRGLSGARYVYVACGASHTVLLRNDGKVVTCGRRADGRCDIPEPRKGTQWVAVAAGFCHTVLLRSDGEVVAVGKNSDGQCATPTLSVGMKYSSMAAGECHTVFLREDGQAVASGDARYGLCTIPKLPPNVRYTAAAAGELHTVLLRSDGQAVACGDNRYGLSSTADVIAGHSDFSSPVACAEDALVVQSNDTSVGDGRCTVPALPMGTTYVSCAAGAGHTVLLRSDGQAVAFGRNREGRCSVPRSPPGIRYVAVATGYWHTVLVQSDGLAVAFGSNSDGQCNVPVLPSGVQYVAAAAGECHTVLLRSDGCAVAFGDDSYGRCQVPPLPEDDFFRSACCSPELADPSEKAADALQLRQCQPPRRPSSPLVRRHFGSVRYVAVAAGQCHTVLLRSDGQVVAFGDNSDGRCLVPSLPPKVTYVGVEAGCYHTVLLRSDGACVAFGYNKDGRCDVPPLPMTSAADRYSCPLLNAQMTYHRVVYTLVQRSISVGDILSFYHNVAKAKGGSNVTDITTTKDIVREIIIPQTRSSQKCWVHQHRLFSEDRSEPVVYVVHAWRARFMDLVGAILHDAVKGNSTSPGENYKDAMAMYRPVLHKRYWVDIFCVNQHHSVCKEEAFGCKCSAAPYKLNMAQCQVNKFIEVCSDLRSLRKGRMILALDRELHCLRRAWCVDELNFALVSGMDLQVSCRTLPPLPHLRRYDCDIEQFGARAEDKARILADITCCGQENSLEQMMRTSSPVHLTASNESAASTARSRSTSPSNAPMSAARKTMQNQFVVSPQVAISAFNRRITQFVRGLADDMVLDAVAESAAAEVTLGAFDFGL
eukprot:TRINITY_DN28364_c0_g5_i1.p1 TRINITY_DN28364_c0_g5~~TRINITY_DN28364_c0_g5_i1.p1  ORF type:complete len:1149 (-),score=203.64 TRINITY_DN28364_c0_g5_i1:86-3532(-)